MWWSIRRATDETCALARWAGNLVGVLPRMVVVVPVVMVVLLLQVVEPAPMTSGVGRLAMAKIERLGGLALRRLDTAGTVARHAALTTAVACRLGTRAGISLDNIWQKLNFGHLREVSVLISLCRRSATSRTSSVV